MVKEYLNKEIPLEWNLMLKNLLEGTQGSMILKETETMYELNLKIPLPKTEAIRPILEGLMEWRGKDNKQFANHKEAEE